ncbi:MAG: DNA alkylation repair protein [Saprospiraceae bacterium]|nr:DNA alkylation repair protein [Saprospiraceae bacterium]
MNNTEKSDLFSVISDWCNSNANPKDAAAMSAYMKDLFIFFGIKSPARKKFVYELKKELKETDSKQMWNLVFKLWNQPQREFHYIAMEILVLRSSTLDIDDIPSLEKLLISDSWWDTVDLLASSCIGNILKKYPDSQKYYSGKWMSSGNLWLQRTSIIFQLKYGKNTDSELLYSNILELEDSKEFFIRKASGWALRQYSKYNPESVLQFVNANPRLSGLTKREALKYIIHDF